MKITALLDALNSALAEPFALVWVSNSPRFLLVFTVIYAVVVIVAVTDQKNTRPGAEHGSAAWGDVFRLNKFYMDRHGSNLLLTQHFHIGIDGYKHKHNTNILIVGGSGAGKTRTYGVPNVLECACSMVITDPKAEILRKTGNLLKQKGYEVIVFDLINPAASFCYNPFVYVHDDREVLTLIENLIQNTTPSHSKSSDPFWEKSETALLQALMLYLLHEAPPEEQNFSMVMEMISAAEVHEDDDNYQSPLDILFERLEMREPDSIACKQYRIFKQAAGKTAKSILVSVGVRLAAFNLPSIAKLTMADELHLQELGERKIALFCCIPDSDKSLNYLVGMIYTQLIQPFVLTPFRRAALIDCIALLQNAGGLPDVPRYLLNRLGEAESLLRLFLLQVPSRILYIDYDADGQPTFCAASSRVPQLLRSALWNTREPAILTSGTLAAAGDFSHTEQLLGLAAYAPLRHFRADSPFNYKKKCLLYFPPRVKMQMDNRKMAEEIVRLVGACHGHALVLFTSYRQMAEVRALTDGQWTYPTYQAWRNGGKIIQQFKQSGNGVLFAAGSCWEGIDFPGDMVSLLIIAKLPFPIPDPVSDYERQQYPNLRDYINAEIIPEMQKKLRQGFGRAIRTEQDSCVVAILDERAGIGGKYHDAALAALPTCPTTEKIEDVQQFIREQKRSDYFL